MVGPGSMFAVEGAGPEAAMQDLDQAVAELAQRGLMTGAAGAELVAIGPDAG